MIGKLRGILEVIEYLDPTGQEIVRTADILGFLRSILLSRLTELLGEVQTSLLDLPAHYDELGTGLRAQSSDGFEGIGLLFKSVYLRSISIPPEVEKASDERASMGAIGDMQMYMQFKAARALGDAARIGGGEGGSFAGMGVGLGLGTAMASAICQATLPQSQTGASVTPAGQAADLVEGFAGREKLVSERLTLSTE